MEKVIAKIAGLGVPGIVLLAAIGATGYTGAAAITAALAALGPGGMLGGIALLGVAGILSSTITEYGFDVILTGVVKELYKRGETKDTIIYKINKYPVSKALKAKLKAELEKV